SSASGTMISKQTVYKRLRGAFTSVNQCMLRSFRRQRIYRGGGNTILGYSRISAMSSTMLDRNLAHKVIIGEFSSRTAVVDYLEENIHRMVLPVRSSDVNQIEHLWDAVGEPLNVKIHSKYPSCINIESF
ncbi:hypothetical protein TNCV_3340561, partial [Trichonephila clavipes]